MGVPTMLINHSGYAISFWHKNIAPQYADDYNRLGVIYYDDLMVLGENPTDDGWNTINIWRAAFDGVWYYGEFWMYNFGTGTPAAFKDPFGYYQDVYIPEIGDYRGGRIFDVRRHCRIWDANNNVIDGIDAGDLVMAYDGNQVTGVNCNLCVRAYQKNGTWYFGSDYGQVSCDTDLENDYHNNDTMTVYSPNWT